MDAILVIDDDPDVQALAGRALAGLPLAYASNLREAREKMAELPDLGLVLLDLGLPDGDGFSFFGELAAGDGERLPVIVLTGSEDERDVVTAFSLGAEDFVRKPFAPLELRARVTSRLASHRHRARRARTLEVGDVEIDVEGMRTYRCSDECRTELDLTTTEQRLLHALAEKRDRVLTREGLLARVWAGAVVGHRTVDTHVANLRSKLRGAGLEIEAIRGVGYRLREAPASPPSA